MPEPGWHQDDASQSRLAPGGFGQRIGFGGRPALLIVDMQRGFTEPASPLGLEQTETVFAIQQLLDAARQVDHPVFYTVTSYRPDMTDAGVWALKAPAIRSLTDGSPYTEIDPRILPRDRDYVIPKKRSSAFFMTNFLGLLGHHEVDTLIVTGCVTSACVRATVVDAASYDFRVIVPEEAVTDVANSHRASLLDIDMKYGDVVSTDSAVEYLLSSRRAGPGSDQTEEGPSRD